jgi:hypothetical protein
VGRAFFIVVPQFIRAVDLSRCIQFTLEVLDYENSD